MASDEIQSSLICALREHGFQFLQSAQMRELLARHDNTLPDWPEFAASWNDLAPDIYLAQVGRQRRRRYAVFNAVAGQPIKREPHQAHFQSSSYNVLQGDIQRWFEPITDAAGDSRTLGSILEFSRALVSQLAPAVARWHLEVHQFRIGALVNAPGEPTPEGVHRDGVECVVVMLVDRQNVESGTTTIHTADGTQLDSFTLTHPLDSAIVDDVRVYHGVTPVRPLDPALPAYRDVLVVTLRRDQGPHDSR